jgi:hypothetical protein
MSRPPADKTDIDPRAIAADFFRRLGGMDGMTKWGRTHRSLAYQLIAKLMAQPATTTFNKVTIKVQDGEAARRKLEDAFIRLIESRERGDEYGTVIVNGEVIYRDPQPQAAIAAPVDPPLSTAGARRGTPDPAAATRDESESSKSPQKGPLSTQGSVATSQGETKKNNDVFRMGSSVPGLAAGNVFGEGCDDNLSTTERFYRWSGHGRPP